VAPSLAELRSRPDDRELLLVYGDWLESQGDPRGELIAVQDAEQHCASLEEFEAARARALELIEHAELLPDTSGLGKVWASWQGGFIRRLELLLDEVPAEGKPRWDRLIVSLLEHPSLALLNELLIRFDGDYNLPMAVRMDFVRTEIARLGRSWPTAKQSRWRPLVAVWTNRVPSSVQRDEFFRALPHAQTLWYSTDLTRFPPPPDSPVVALERALIGRGDAARFELVWFDARGRFRELVATPSFAVHVRHMAEHRHGPLLACHDPVPQRRIAGLLDNLAARFDVPARAQPLAPRPLVERRPQSIELANACARLGDDGSLLPALANFTDVEWWWIEERCEGGAWLGLCGLGREQLLAFARLF
jgi:uncharacterized protein (TIGR02996 family)